MRTGLLNLRYIIRDDFWEFPEHETTIGSDTSEAVAKDCHVCDAGLLREDVG